MVYLTFIDEKVQMNDFFNKNEIIFYKNINDLADKIKFFIQKMIKLKKLKLQKMVKKKNILNYLMKKKITKYFIDISLGNKILIL